MAPGGPHVHPMNLAIWDTLINIYSFPSQVIDNYMLEQARKDELSVETFSRMVQAVPNDSRENHDLIFEVLESLLKSGGAQLLLNEQLFPWSEIFVVKIMFSH